MKSVKLTISALVFLVSTMMLHAQDWPQYFGPERNGISPQKGLLRTWPEKGPQVIWTANVGIGFGGPVIKDGKVYLLDRDDKTGDKIRCFDLTTGKELWNFGYDAPGAVQFPGTRCVPTIDGNRIYSVGPYGQFYCIDINTHKPLWNKNIWTDFGGGQIPRWAVTQCPLIYGDLVIVAPQTSQAGVVAYEKLTGKIKWQTPSIGGTGYVSPALVKVGKESHVVMISASQGRGPNAGGGKVAGFDPLTGKQLWEYTGWQCGIPVPGPVDASEGKILITGGYNAGAAMIKVEKKSDGSYNVSELYKNPDFGSHTQNPIFYNGNFYAQYTTNERRDGLVCMSIDGKVKWKTGRDPLFDKGGMILADGLLLVTDGAKKLFLVQPDPTAFKPVSQVELLSESGPGTGNNQNWAPLALSNGNLLIRDQTKLVCLKVVK